MEDVASLLLLSLIVAMCLLAARIIKRQDVRSESPVAQAPPGWVPLPANCTPGPHTMRDVASLRRTSQRLPFAYSGTLFLGTPTVAFALGLLPTMGRCVNGGVLRSPDLRNILTADLPLADEPQEWVALEGGLALLDPTVDGCLVFKWTDITSVCPLAVFEWGDALLELTIALSSGKQVPVRVQANAEAMIALYDIARAAGVPVK